MLNGGWVKSFESKKLRGGGVGGGGERIMPREIFRSLTHSPHDSISHHTTIPHHALKCVFLSLPFSCLLYVRSQLQSAVQLLVSANAGVQMMDNRIELL